MFRPVAALLQARSIALVGASETGGAGWAKQVYDNFSYCGFPARIYLVNPNRSELWGQRVYADFASLPEPIDLAVTIIPARHIVDTLTEAAEHGLKCALIYAAQFGEGNDAQGATRAAALGAIVERYGMRISGPNCMGALAIRERLLLYPAARVRTFPAGSVGVVFQSGGTFQFWLQQAAVRGLGFSYAVSSGNELDLDLADYINFMLDDTDTKIIACMVEGVRRPEALMAVAEKALALRKPILVVKSGRTNRAQEAAASHTGALAGDDAVFGAMCRKYGIVRCHSLDDLIETCLAFSEGRLPRGPRIAMAGYSGGAKGLFLDYASEEGAVLAELTRETAAQLVGLIDPGLPPENPLDVGAGTGTQGDKFAKICAIVCADPNVDMLAMHGQLPVSADDPVNPAPFATVLASTNKPVVAIGRTAQNMTDIGRDFQQRAGVPFLQGLSATIRALQGLAHQATARRRGIVPLPPPRGAESALAGDAFERLLSEYGLAPPRGGMAKTPDAAAALATDIGFPVAVKIVSPAALHKTEVGGVALHLGDERAVSAGADAMAQRLLAQNPQAEVVGFLVQEMVDGLEVLVGVREDAHYGPFMVVGLGGVFVEVLKDVAIRLLPVDEEVAREMVSSLRGSALFGAFRGKPERDVEQLVRAIAGLSSIFIDHRTWLSDLEINPLLVLAKNEGVRAVDVRAVRRSAPTPAAT